MNAINFITKAYECGYTGWHDKLSYNPNCITMLPPFQKPFRSFPYTQDIRGTCIDRRMSLAPSNSVHSLNWESMLRWRFEIFVSHNLLLRLMRIASSYLLWLMRCVQPSASWTICGASNLVPVFKLCLIKLVGLPFGDLTELMYFSIPTEFYKMA